MRLNSAGCREREIAQFIENDRIHVVELLDQIAGFALLFFFVELIDQIDRVVKADAFTPVVGGNADGGGQMGFAGSGAADQNQVSYRLGP